MRYWLLLLGIVCGGVTAQPYPSKPVRIVVPYTAGGPADLLVRGLGQKLNDVWGQQVIVENKPGANEIIAAQDIAKSPPMATTTCSPPTRCSRSTAISIRSCRTTR